MHPHVIFAVFRRNFAAYFSSPIGYVFICAFVLLSGIAAFWPNEFFNANLASLDQLNKHLPLIMLVFIPAITMSIWADERRQGTDELILTLPCTDQDVVIGKYMAAVMIFTVALVFSMSNMLVLRFLGRPDLGVLLSNYVGYWLVGAAMLSIGMVGSFLTNSLTVSFILAMALNAPLVFAGAADSIVLWENAAQVIKNASIEAHFEEFGRGLITLSGVVFFASIVVVSLYLSMVLIGRRHWVGGPKAGILSAHFAVRTIALIATVVGLNVIVDRVNVRADVSEGNINSLSPQTLAMLRSLDTPRPVIVEAYVSPQAPEELIQTRLNLLSMLRAVDARGGDNVIVRIHNTPRFSPQEAQAEQLYGIRPQQVQSTAGGKMAIDEVVLGAAFTCGLDKVVVPFFDKGMPVEYEVIRSIATVAQASRKKIGVVMTDAKLFGGFEIETMQSRPEEKIIEELRKQYEVVQVNAEQPITEEFDALLAVQPSSLSPTALDNFIAAVKSGQPTAIFEDPFPFFDGNVPATSQPRQPRNRNPFMQQPPPQPKGFIPNLWNTLGVRFNDREVIWQDYNPFPKLAELFKEFVFISPAAGQLDSLNADNVITSGLRQILTVFPGSIMPAEGATTTFTPLARTGRQTGSVAFDEILIRDFFGSRMNPQRRLRPTGQSYVLAAHMTGRPPTSESQETPTHTSPGSMNVVLFSDIDVLYSVFFAMRARGSSEDDPVKLDLDNFAFVLNTLDFLAGDDRFIDIRKRKPAYRTLTTVEAKTEAARASANEQSEKFIQQFESKKAEEQAKLDAKLAELQQRQGVDPMQMMREVELVRRTGQDRMQTATERLEKQRDAELAKIERQLAVQVRRVQDGYKFAAVALPPIPPLILGAIVFYRRRAMERIGVPKARLGR